MKKTISAIKHIINQIHSGKKTLYRQLTMYLLALFAVFSSGILLLLLLTGLLNPLDAKLESFMTHTLAAKKIVVDKNVDKLTSHGMLLSQELSRSMTTVLSEHNAGFADLNNNPKLLSEIQYQTYDILTKHLQQVPCSGVFYILKTSSNTNWEKKYANSVYIKYTNMYSQNTFNTEYVLFRGSSELAKTKGINLYSVWQPELDLNYWPEVRNELEQNSHTPKYGVTLLPTHHLKDSWERARLFVQPIYDDQNNIIGICGFELSNLYFQLSVSPFYYRDYPLIIGFVTENPDGTYSGVLSDETSLDKWPMRSYEYNNYTVFYTDNIEYIGKTLTIDIGNQDHVLSIMMTKTAYDSLLANVRIKGIIIFSIIVFFSALAVYYLNQKYVKPIVADLQQLQENPDHVSISDLEEIQQLYTSWKENDSKNQEYLKALEEECSSAQQSYEKAEQRLQAIHKQQMQLQENYDQLQTQMYTQLTDLQKQLQKLNEQKEAALQHYNEAQSALENISDEKLLASNRDGFQFYLDNLHLLTKKEKDIFKLYPTNMSFKEIAQQLGITENTLKYHNKNIYSKLGLKSRKEAMQFIRLEQKYSQPKA